MPQIDETIGNASVSGPDENHVLRALAEDTAAVTGEEFFAALVRLLAGLLGVRYAMVAEFANDRFLLRTRAFWNGDRPGKPFEYPLSGTPCEVVVSGRLCHYPQGVAQQFPGDAALRELGIRRFASAARTSPCWSTT